MQLLLAIDTSEQLSWVMPRLVLKLPDEEHCEGWILAARCEWLADWDLSFSEVENLLD